MFVWKALVILVEIQKHQPAISIDYAVLEPSDKVMPVFMGWSDVGSWDAVFTVAKNIDWQTRVKYLCR